MKHLIFACLLCAATSLHAQFAIKTQPIAFLYRQFPLNVEYAFAPSHSAVGTVSVLAWTFPIDDVRFSLTSFRFAPEYRFYPNGKNNNAPAGFYLGPYGSVSSATFKATVASDPSTGQIGGSGKIGAFIGSIGGQLGYQFLIEDIVVIDILAGLGYVAGSIGDIVVRLDDGTTETVPFELPLGLPVAGVLPKFGFGVGVHF